MKTTVAISRSSHKHETTIPRKISNRLMAFQL